MNIIGTGAFLPEEMEFFAEDHLITIIPNFSLPTADGGKLLCMTGHFGLFQPNVPLQVPLWLGLALHKRRRCRIQPPDWMHPDKLQELYDQERDTAAVFQELPFHYIEIAHLLLRHAKDCFSELYKVKNLVESLRKVRGTKIDAGLKVLQGPMTVKLNNLSAMECNVIRPFFQGALDQFYKLGKMEAGQQDSQSSQRLSVRNRS